MDVETREEISHCVLKGSDSPAAAEVYNNSRQRRLMIYALGLERYRRLIEPMSDAVRRYTHASVSRTVFFQHFLESE